MNLEDLRNYCLSMPYATEDMPFGQDFLVFRLAGKIFVLTNLNDTPPFVNLKCDPTYAEELREKYPQITTGYHMNKKHWNTIFIENFPEKILQNLIKHSYDEVLKKLSKKDKMALNMPHIF